MHSSSKIRIEDMENKLSRKTRKFKGFKSYHSRQVSLDAGDNNSFNSQKFGRKFSLRNRMVSRRKKVTTKRKESPESAAYLKMIKEA